MSEDEKTEVEKTEDTRTDKEKIEADEWADCWICKAVFRRRRETARYCAKCGRGFCEGEHGSFAWGIGTCIVCGAKKDDLKLGGKI